MRYCKIQKCENFKGVQDSRVYMFRMPKDDIGRIAWENALNGQKCSSSKYVCIEHFTPDDYTNSHDGKRFHLKTGVVPSVFEVSLIEVGIDEDEEFDDNNISIAENNESNDGMSSGFGDLVSVDENTLELQNMQLRKEVERLKCSIESKRIIQISRDNYAKIAQQRQLNEIQSLNHQVQQLNATISHFEKQNIMRSQLTIKQNEIIDCLISGVKTKQKYPETFRQFCFTMHFHSPRAYEFLRETFSNHLPHPGTIRSWYANSDLNTEPNKINDQCLNIIRRKVMEKAENGEKLICAVLFDEMSIRKHIQWSHAKRQLIGYSKKKNDGNSEPSQDDKKTSSDVANQALVFIVRAVNDSFELPISYYFINSMKGNEKSDLVLNIIESLMDCHVIVSNVTFDGFQANKKMCKLLGAVLNVYSPFFTPYVRVRSQNIYIFFDVCHMIKLVRNNLGAKEVLYDDVGDKIRWQYFIDLVRMKDHGFSITHKMNQSHIDWRRKKMKVNLAVQTFSESTAASLEFLMNTGVSEFQGAEATIRAIRIFDPLFDIFNSKHDRSENIFKRVLSKQNAAEIFELFSRAIRYIKLLKVVNAKGKLIRVCNSNINTGFNGFIINMISLKFIFQEFIEEKQLITSLKTYSFQQDPVEILFGKIRSLNGFNDNPTCEQFSAAFRKLLAYNTIMFSKFSNCKATEDSISNPYSNILSITSRRPALETQLELNISQDVTEEQIDELYEKLAEIEASKNDKTEELSDCSIAHIANHIENRIKTTMQFSCAQCKFIFEEYSSESDDVPIGIKSTVRPCYSTFIICKQADRFLKVNLLKESINFKVIHHEILQNLNFDMLYIGTDFTDHLDHKIYLIRFIVDEYIRVKGTQIAKTATLKEHENSLRVKLHKLLHYLGQ